MKLILIALFLISSNVIYAQGSCTIETFEKILYLPSKNKSNTEGLIRKSDCPKAVNNAFIDQIFNSSGSLSGRIVNTNEEIKKSGYNVNLVPHKVNVSNIKERLKSHFELDRKWSFADLKMLNKKLYIGLNGDESLDFKCEFCHTTGEKNISLIAYSSSNKAPRTYWISATVYISTEVLVPTRAISPSEPQLAPGDFMLKPLKVTRPEQYFTNKDQLIFYKLNKPLAEGTGLKYTDLTPVNLVSAGVPTKVILKSNSLVLEGTAIPSQSGKFGEIIKLQNPKTKRMITGKVIDFNKVSVDL